MGRPGVASRAGFWVASSAAFVLLTLSLVAVHVRSAGEQAIAECDRALASGDVTTAIERARDAAMALAPGSPYPEQGYARLRSIATTEEARGSFDQATSAWRAIWTAIRATRREGAEAERLAEAGHGLVRVATRVCEAGQTRPPATCGATVQAALAEDDLPPLSKFAGVALGAVAFLGGGVLAAQTAERRRRLAGLAAMSVGAVILTVTLLTR
jgi:hypothetical protein